MLNSVQRCLFREIHLISIKPDIPLTLLWRVVDHYNETHALKSATIHNPDSPWVIHFPASPKEALFQRIDLDNNGKISADELEKAFEKVYENDALIVKDNGENATMNWKRHERAIIYMLLQLYMVVLGFVVDAVFAVAASIVFAMGKDGKLYDCCF